MRRWQDAKARVEAERVDAGELAARVEFLEFQLGEIDRVAPLSGEDELLRNERSRLANADRLKTLAGGAYATLYERDDSVMSSLGAVWRQLDELAALDSALTEQAAARDAVVPLLEDLAHTLRSYAAAVEVSPDKLADVEARLADIERLVRKYGGSLDAVLERRRTMAAEVEDLADGGKRRTALEADAVKAREAYLAAARALSVRRVEGGATARPGARSRVEAPGDA